MTDDRVSRRTLLAGGLAMAATGLAATPAAAQLDQLLGQVGSQLGGQAGLGDMIGTANALMKGMDLSEKDEIAMAEAYYPRFIGQSGGLYNSRKAQEALKRFADPILRTSGRALPWDIVLVDNETVNAWALPGGKLAVHKGLLRYASSPEELAAVIAHEVAHAELSHGGSKAGRGARDQDAFAASGLQGNVSNVHGATQEGDEVRRALEKRGKARGLTIGDDDFTALRVLRERFGIEHPPGRVDDHIRKFTEGRDRPLPVVVTQHLRAVREEDPRHCFLLQLGKSRPQQPARLNSRLSAWRCVDPECDSGKRSSR